MNKLKYRNNVSVKTKEIKQQTTDNKVQYKKTDKNIQQQHCKQLVYIYRDFAKAETFSFKCRLRTLRYKRQDRVGNIDSVRILSALCKDTRFRENSVSLV